MTQGRYSVEEETCSIESEYECVNNIDFLKIKYLFPENKTYCENTIRRKYRRFNFSLTHLHY